MDTSLIVSIAALVVSVIIGILSYVVARRYGDLAAVRASRKLHEEDARKARSTAFQSLLNEIERVRRLAEYNSGLGLRARLPTAAFETAFASGAPGLAAGSKLLNVVADYLALADTVNMCIDGYVAGVSSGEHKIRRQMRIAYDEIGGLCADILPGILDQMRDALQHELDCIAPES